MLKIGEVVRYACRPGAKAVAVENFLTSADSTIPLELHLQNLQADARSYKWSNATVQAIRAGLFEEYKEEARNE